MPAIVQHARKSTVILTRPFVDTVTFTGLRLERQTKTFVRKFQSTVCHAQYVMHGYVTVFHYKIKKSDLGLVSAPVP